MGAIVAQLFSAATAAIKRRVIVYALYVASGLFTIFAVGYALNALHASLMFRWGAITASLVVAGGLLLCAICLIIAGYLLSRSQSPSLYQRLQASPEVSKTAKLLTRPKRTMAPAAAGAIAGAVAVGTFAFLRRRRPSVQDAASQMGHHNRFD